jgi:hypothetical protein
MDIVVVGNFNIGNRNIAPGFTRTGWWYDYLNGDSMLVNDVNEVISFSPGEYHVFTSRKINLEFKISTSLKDFSFAPQSLIIYPTINHGQFIINFSETVSGIFDIRMMDVSGRIVSLTSRMIGDDIEIVLNQNVPGLYIVQILHNQKIYSGKVIVH